MQITLISVVAILGGALAGCNLATEASKSEVSKVSSPDLTTAARQPQFAAQLPVDPSAPAANYNGLFMRSDGTYELVLNSSTPEATFRLSIDGGAPVLVRPGIIHIPSADIPMPTLGDHMLRIEAELDNVIVPYNLPMNVACPAGVSSSFSVNPAAISVSTVAPNVYTYSGAAVPSGGMGPFECAWDYNGDGIVDSLFASCNQPVTAYSNHVDLRTVRVFVRDTQCFNILQAERAVALTAPATLAPPLVYITGTVANSSANLAGNKTVNLRHLSSNPAGMPAKVQCNYSRTNGKGVFTVTGLYTYGLSSSKQHGMTVSFENLEDTINATGVLGSGTISSANATIRQVRFATDEAPDLQNQLVFTGGATQCTGSITATPVAIGGVPCANIGSGIASDYVVRGQGTFSCTNLPASGAASSTINISNGSFYCEYRLVDQCSGGGGGGGGVAPIVL